MRHLPVHCFPNAAWLAEAASADVVLDLHEYYEKQTLRNRFEILGVNGKMTLSIPVEGQKGVKTLSKDVKIANHDWRKLHLTSIRSAYGRAPFYEHYFDELADIFLEKQAYLADFNLQVLDWLKAKKLSITTAQSTAFIPYSEKQIPQPCAMEEPPAYLQVFSDRFPFSSGLSVIDLLMNLGPRSADHILLWKNGK